METCTSRQIEVYLCLKSSSWMKLNLFKQLSNPLGPLNSTIFLIKSICGHPWNRMGGVTGTDITRVSSFSSVLESKAMISCRLSEKGSELLERFNCPFSRLPIMLKHLTQSDTCSTFSWLDTGKLTTTDALSLEYSRLKNWCNSVYI